jgi:hypothetical protein
MNPLCPTDCTTALGGVLFDDCAPNINPSEIKRVLVSKGNAAPFDDWTVATEWTTRLEMSGAAADPIRPLTVIGDKPAPSSVTKDISNNRKWVVGKDHTLNFTVDDVSDENYEFMRATECGGKYRLWYETHGGYLYGGNDGIKATIVMDDVLNRGIDEIETLNGVATWRSKFSPERVKSPIYKED